MRPTGPNVLRVVTYNVLKNTPAADTAAALADLDADIILLQEVTQNSKGSGREDQPELLRQALQMNGYYVVSYEMEGGTAGPMVLSRYPIRDGCAINMPNGHHLGTAATIHVNGRAIRVYSIHLSSTYKLSPIHIWQSCAGRRREARRVAEVIDKDLAASIPVILGGDLNASPHTRPYNAFSSLLTDCASAVGRARATLPKKLPVLRYDLVFVSDHFTPLTAGVKRGPSDHLVVIVDVELSDAPP